MWRGVELSPFEPDSGSAPLADSRGRSGSFSGLSSATQGTAPRLSIVIPTLDESSNLKTCLGRLAGMRERGHEVIVVDGGSRDDTVELIQGQADQVLQVRRGRARQMNAGAAAASGDMLLFLHADTRLPADADRLIFSALASGRHVWGRFDVRLSGTHWLFPIVAGMMNLRSCITGVATGDQGLFTHRSAFASVGGFPDIPLMEDIEISLRLKRRSRPVCLRQKAITSSRRWEQRGVVRTVLLMWALRLAYALGVSPERLVGIYYAGRPGAAVDGTDCQKRNVAG